MASEIVIYDLRDLSKKLKLSIRTLREYIKRGRLEGRLIGRAYYVTEPNLIKFLESN